MPARQNGHLSQMTAEWHGVDWIYRRACVVAAMCWNEVAISTIIQYTALQVAGDWAHLSSHSNLHGELWATHHVRGTSFLRSLRLHDAKNLSEELNAADLGQTVLSDLGTFESWSPGTELGREQGAFACHKNTESMQMQDLVMQAKWDMNNQWVGTTEYANTRKLAELNDHWGAQHFVHESYSAQTTPSSALYFVLVTTEDSDAL